jgi:hypothetical protein
MKRVALVIANSDYKSVGVLPKAAMDGVSMKNALVEHDFEVVEFVENGTRGEMLRAIKKFENKVEQNKPCVAFTYYAGHGKDAGGKNYLIPIDYKPPADELDEEEDFAVSLDDRLIAVLNGPKVRHKDTLNIMMLDCCREDRSNQTWRSRGSGSGSDSVRGLSWAKHRAGPSGPGSSQFFIGYGCAPGCVSIERASDTNGVYTGAFLKALAGPSKSFELLQFFKAVGAAVHGCTNGDQIPHMQVGGVRVDFRFVDIKNDFTEDED